MESRERVQGVGIKQPRRFATTVRSTDTPPPPPRGHPPSERRYGRYVDAIANPYSAHHRARLVEPPLRSARGHDAPAGGSSSRAPGNAKHVRRRSDSGWGLRLRLSLDRVAVARDDGAFAAFVEWVGRRRSCPPPPPRGHSPSLRAWRSGARSESEVEDGLSGRRRRRCAPIGAHPRVRIPIAQNRLHALDENRRWGQRGHRAAAGGSSSRAGRSDPDLGIAAAA